MDGILNELYLMQDIKYRDFNSALIPTVDKENIIGVRVPQLRKLAKTMIKDGRAEEFLLELPHRYYEENFLHALIISLIGDEDTLFYELERFLPYVDNWAVCDSMRPILFKRHKDELIAKIPQWLKSEEDYTLRFAIEMLMTHFLDGDFDKKYSQWVVNVKSEKYYVNMMQAWYFATALAKQWDANFPYIKEKCLPAWVQNKTIQKANESYRITAEQKKILKEFLIK